ncbi:hypothetical protein C5167_022576, partial [Papaver somniferum]
CKYLHFFEVEDTISSVPTILSGSESSRAVTGVKRCLLNIKKKENLLEAGLEGFYEKHQEQENPGGYQAAVEKVCLEVVSCAEILSARDSVAMASLASKGLNAKDLAVLSGISPMLSNDLEGRAGVGGTRVYEGGLATAVAWPRYGSTWVAGGLIFQMRCAPWRRGHELNLTV